jgi:hypothetical protein
MQRTKTPPPFAPLGQLKALGHDYFMHRLQLDPTYAACSPGRTSLAFIHANSSVRSYRRQREESLTYGGPSFFQVKLAKVCGRSPRNRAASSRERNCFSSTCIFILHRLMHSFILQADFTSSANKKITPKTLPFRGEF